MLQFIHAANGITLLGLWFAIGCALLSVSGRPDLAIVSLIAAGVCDFLDGAVSRRLDLSDDARTFGARLDSVVDACSFGACSTLLFWSLGVRAPWQIPVLLLFPSCAVWRLAYFDTFGLESEGGRSSYVGLPTTFVALVVPLVMLLAPLVPGKVHLLATACAFGLAIAMVSPVRIPKPRGIWYIILPITAVAVGATYLSAGDRLLSVH